MALQQFKSRHARGSRDKRGEGVGQVTETVRRVVQFSTGNVGVHALRVLIGRPDFKLVGVHAADPAKSGREPADVCGVTEPTRIIAHNDIDALIALDPDCVVYTAQGETRPMDVIEQMSKLLSAGINIVATSMVWLVTP